MYRHAYTGAERRTELLKWTPLVALIIVFCSFFYFDGQNYLTLETLQAEQQLILAWTALHYYTAVALYIGIFTLMVAAALPCATLGTLIGGFLFGPIAIVYAVFSTTAGGVLLYLAVRTALGKRFKHKASGWARRLEVGFKKNAFHYLLTLRLMPIFPCWLSNIGAGLLNVPLKTFLTASILGLTPATILYVLLGQSFNHPFTSLTAFLLRPAILIPLISLSLFSLISLFYRYLIRSY